ELKEAAAEANSIASWSQATAAADMGSDPAPPNMRAELISGGNVEKFMAPTFPGCTEFMAAHQPAERITSRNRHDQINDACDDLHNDEIIGELIDFGLG
ncbi:hypothetical protein A5629_04115, partial [Mycobacterium tuberculosis]